VTCLVRAPSQAQAARRLAEVYGPGSRLHDRFAALASQHLRVVAGGLEELSRQHVLAEEIDTVVHAAAHVSHALSYEQLSEPNVVGTALAIRFALTGRPKRFNFVSTNSVSLALLGDRDLAREGDDTRALGDRWPLSGEHANGYRISKWAGEVLAQDLAETYGVPVNVFRCNLILPPGRWRGQVNGDDFLTRLVRSVVATGIYPASFYDDPERAHLDGLPVDVIAPAIADIGTSASRGYAVYHVNNVHWDDGISLDTLMRRLVAAGHPLACVADHAAWFERFARALPALDPPRRARSSLAIVGQWRAPLATARRRRIDASRFCARAGTPPSLDAGYLDRYLEDMLR
jgi:fatty acid CoA ligase FadD9